MKLNITVDYSESIDAGGRTSQYQVGFDHTDVNWSGDEAQVHLEACLEQIYTDHKDLVKTGTNGERR